MIRELNNVPGYQRVLIVDEVDDPDNPGQKIAKHTETTASNYVGVMAERMAKEQLQVQGQRNSLATHNLTLQQQVAAKDAEIEALLAQLAAHLNKPAESTEPTGGEDIVAGDGASNGTSAGASATTGDKSNSTGSTGGQAVDLTGQQSANLTSAITDLNKKGKGGK